jgi:hypothetical protein
MTRALVLATLLLAGCKEEPTIVITFSPQDLALRPAETPRAPALSDGGKQPAAAARPDAGQVWAPDPSAKKGGVLGSDPCSVDDDCELAKADCCGCTGGGAAVAMAKSRAKSWEKEIAGRCENTACLEVMSTDPSCSGKAVCVNGKCALMTKGGKPPKGK